MIALRTLASPGPVVYTGPMKTAASLVVISSLGLLLSVAPTASAASPTNCTALQKQAAKAAKKGQKAKAKRLRQQARTCKQAATVRTALAGYTFTGTRGDGQAVSVTLCADGRWQSKTGSRPVAISTGTTWLVRSLRYSNGTQWVTQVAENADRRAGGWSIGMARAGDAFQVGIASFDEVSDLGPVTRTDGAAVCATL